MSCLWALLACAGADAACLDSADAEGRRLQALAERDARAALSQSSTALESALRVQNPDPRQLAALYAAQATSYSLLELDAEARDSVARGLPWTRGLQDPDRLNLLIAEAENVYDTAGLARSIDALENTRSGLVPGSSADTCLLIALGRAQYRADRIDLAVRSLTRAYANATDGNQGWQRVLAADALAPVMRAAGDLTQARSLMQEVLDWDSAHGLTQNLAAAHYGMGEVLSAMGQHAGAIEELKDSRGLSQQIGDRQGIAFSDMRICAAQAELGQRQSARAACESALQVFQSNQSAGFSKDVRVILARLDLADGHPGAALADLAGLLEGAEADVEPRLAAEAFELRARAEAADGQYPAAARDYGLFAERLRTANDADRVRQETILRTRFEADREVARNASLRRELALERERTEHQRSQLQWSLALGAASLIVIVLLAHIVLSGRRTRAQLQRLACEDALTGLPNRRQTALQAEAALALASRQGHVVTVAMIDLDHFKQVNDRCGHAVGDQVLLEFARRGRTHLRAGDILGRWGGEEFLLVMSGCTLEQGLASLERLRLAAAAIVLPESARGLKVTLSAGLTTNEDGPLSLDKLVARADAALYEAKHGGRDLVRIAEEDYRIASTGVRRAMGRA